MYLYHICFYNGIHYFIIYNILLSIIFQLKTNGFTNNLVVGVLH